MSPLRPLPVCIGTVVVPDAFSVTATVSSSGCRLRAVLASSDSSWYRLPSGPEAAIGTLVHKVMEKWAGRSSASLTPEQLFDAEYAAVVRELESDVDRRHFANLAATRSPSQWSMVRRRAIAQCSNLSPPAHGSTGSGTSAKGLRVGSEIDLASKALRIHGRADRIDQEKSGYWVVRDYKTGSAVTPEGDPRPEYALQMQCYALMIEEAAPSSHVRLILDDGDEIEVPFNHEVRDSTREFLENTIASMPVGGSVVDARQLANPGGACATCVHRVVCAAYQDRAPHWWRDYPPNCERIPMDTWGCVLDVVRAGQTAVTLEDEAGRRVKIDRLDPRHGLSDVRTGVLIRVFSLNSVGAARGFDGRRFHPRNFYELPRDQRERRAWGVVAFGQAQISGK